MKLAFALPILSLNTCMQTSPGPSVHFLICKTSKQTRTDAGGTLNLHAGTPRAEGNRTRNLLCPSADGANHRCGKISVNIPTVSSLCTHSLCTDLAAHFSLAAQKLPFTQTHPPPITTPAPHFPLRVHVYTWRESEVFSHLFFEAQPSNRCPNPQSSPSPSPSPNPGHLSAELLFLLLFSPDILQALAHARKNADAAPLGRPCQSRRGRIILPKDFLPLFVFNHNANESFLANCGPGRCFLHARPCTSPPTLASG